MSKSDLVFVRADTEVTQCLPLRVEGTDAEMLWMTLMDSGLGEVGLSEVGCGACVMTDQCFCFHF